MHSIKTSHLVLSLLLVFFAGMKVNSAIKDAIWRADALPTIAMVFNFLSPVGSLLIAGFLLFRPRPPLR